MLKSKQTSDYPLTFHIHINIRQICKIQPVQIPNRPLAYGRYDETTRKGQVDFTDDQRYKLTFNTKTGIIDWDGLERPWSGDKRREWDGTNHWQKDTPDVAGQYYHVNDQDQSGCGAGIDMNMYLHILYIASN